jgi:hypothetical protein
MITTEEVIMWVKFINNAAADVTFNIRWNNASGQQDGPPTSSLLIDQNQSQDLSNLAIDEGTSCWAHANPNGGVTHDSGDNFTFTKGAGTVTYLCSGTVDSLSFSMS